MRLDGKVNKIERIVASFRHGEVGEEKRVFHLNVRLPDPSLEQAYTYGYGQMHFILHGKAMKDFVDLGGQVDIYVVPKGDGADVPVKVLSDLRTDNYRLEGEVASLTKSNAMLKERSEEGQKERTALHQRLTVAMNEVMRLEARLGEMPKRTTAMLEGGTNG